MSSFFPHVNLNALGAFATAAVTIENDRRKQRRFEQWSQAQGWQTSAPQSTETPKVNSFLDVEFGGDRMILIAFDWNSVPYGPKQVLAHFPSGRSKLSLQALCRTTSFVQDHLSPVGVNPPRIYQHKEMPNEIGADVVLLQRAPGEQLDKIWTTLSKEQQQQVVSRLGTMMLAMFDCRTRLISSFLEEKNNQPSHDVRPARNLLLASQFDDGPLKDLPPQPALQSSAEYLHALADRIDRVFSSSPVVNQLARDTGFPKNPKLTDPDVARIKETWRRLKTLIPYHTGGFYTPASLADERAEVLGVLTSHDFALLHPDLRMSRFIINWYTPDQGPALVNFTVYGWEHAYSAPLWSAARMPQWITPSPLADDPISWECKESIQKVIMQHLCGQDTIKQSWQWVAAYIHGRRERWFEGCIGSHWMFRDTNEILLARLKDEWAREGITEPFPFVVGREYLATTGYTSFANHGQVMRSMARNHAGPSGHHMILDEEMKTKHMRKS